MRRPPLVGVTRPNAITPPNEVARGTARLSVRHRGGAPLNQMAWRFAVEPKCST